jgi:hypothetical protein
MSKSPFTKEPNYFKKETLTQNKTRNNNTRNDGLTNFFSNLLDSTWLQILILIGLTLVITTFGILIYFLAYFVANENIAMIDIVLGIMFKIASPCAILFLFFIKFGEHKNQ